MRTMLFDNVKKIGIIFIIFAHDMFMQLTESSRHKHYNIAYRSSPAANKVQVSIFQLASTMDIKKKNIIQGEILGVM